MLLKETRVDLYEYQAKELFAAHGVPVLPGRTVETAEEAGAAAAELGTAVVVKAQVKQDPERDGAADAADHEASR